MVELDLHEFEVLDEEECEVVVHDVIEASVADFLVMEVEVEVAGEVVHALAVAHFPVEVGIGSEETLQDVGTYGLGVDMQGSLHVHRDDFLDLLHVRVHVDSHLHLHPHVVQVAVHPQEHPEITHPVLLVRNIQVVPCNVALESLVEGLA